MKSAISAVCPSQATGLHSAPAQREHFVNVQAGAWIGRHQFSAHRCMELRPAVCKTTSQQAGRITMKGTAIFENDRSPGANARRAQTVGRQHAMHDQEIPWSSNRS